MSQQETREVRARVYTSFKSVIDIELDPHYVILAVPAQRTTASGLHIPEGASVANKDRLNRVIKAGTEYKHLEGKLAIGFIPSNLGDNIEVDGNLYFIVRGSAIFAWIDESNLSSVLSV